MILTAALAIVSAASWAQTTLWATDTARHEYYRIPAVVAYDEQVIAFADNRSGVTDATSWGDVGSEGNISIETRRSTDGGRTWSAAECAVRGTGSGGYDQSHGDAAVVRDRRTGRLLIMTGSGDVGYGRSKVSKAGDYTEALKVGRYYSDDNGKTWTGGEVTQEIYDMYRGSGNIYRLFFTSGRICQSRRIKRGAYYRIYSAVVTNEGSLVVYSDDFGGTWKPLGGADARPAPEGDEAKIEELPDGRVLLSCRRSGRDGRCFNIYTYDNKKSGSGSWATAAVSESPEGGTATIGNNTNGEILMVPARGADGKRAYVALQSAPRGTKGEHASNLERRSHVSIYWKAFGGAEDWRTPECWVDGWKRYEVTDGHSAYSTMAIGGDGSIHFVYEDEGVRFRLGSQWTEMYNILYRNLTLGEITEGEYRYSKHK